jgi:hypothetical protein
VEVGRKQGGLVSTGAGADFDDRRPVIERIGGNKEDLEAQLERGDGGLGAIDLGLGHRGHLRVVNANELARLRELVIETLEFLRLFQDRGKALMFAP